MDINDLMRSMGGSDSMSDGELLSIARALTKANPELFGKGTRAIMLLVEGHVMSQELIMSLKKHQMALEDKVKSLESRCKTLEGFLAKKAIPDIPGIGDAKPEPPAPPIPPVV